MRKTPGGHNVHFDPSFNCFTLLNQDLVCDFIDMFYAYDDPPNVKWIVKNVSNTDFNGQHLFNPNTREHYITFNEKNIRQSFDSGHRRYGGNVSLPDIDLKMAAALVLTHELQHANQSKTHSGDKNFYGFLGSFTPTGKPRMKHYKGRPCEVNAREFVDAHLNEVLAYFEKDGPRRSKKKIPNDERELLNVVDLLLECAELTLDDVRDELRSSRILNPKNVEIVIQRLRDRGVDLK